MRGGVTVTFIYWDNSKKWHGSKIATIHATDILEADKTFEEIMGKDPQRVCTIGCEIRN